MRRERWILPADREHVVTGVPHIFDRGAHFIAGTNVRVGDAASRFIAGDSIDEIAKDYEVTREHIEAAIRTVLRARKRYP